jgi:hypothetical protein
MNKKKIADRVLERYLLNELPGDQIKEINGLIETDDELKKRVAALKKSNSNILTLYPAETMANQIKDRYRTTQLEREKEAQTKRVTLWKKRLAFASPLLAAAIVFFVILAPFQTNNNTGDDNNFVPIGITRIKGPQKIDMTKTNLLVFRQIENNEVEMLEEGVKAGAGDLLQLAYTVPEKVYGVILSIDGSGVVTLHYPEQDGKAGLLQEKKKISLKSSYQLDDAPGFERFFLITSTQVIDVDAVLQDAIDLARDSKRARSGKIEWKNAGDPGTLNQTSILIVKGDE